VGTGVRSSTTGDAGQEAKTVIQSTPQQHPRKSVLTVPPAPSIPTQREVLAQAGTFEERLAVLYGDLSPELLKKLRAASTGRRPVTVRSVGWRYTFYVFRKGTQRLAVKRTREPRQRDVERVAAILAKQYTCVACAETFVRRGRQRFCSPGCKVDHRRRTRNGTLWSAKNLSPAAQGVQAVARAAAAERAERLDRQARREQASSHALKPSKRGKPMRAHPMA
jgi:hypothetical protein